jgi:hypothetical protein
VNSHRYFDGYDTIYAKFTLKISTTQVYESVLTGAMIYYFEVQDDSLGSWRVLAPWTVWIERNKEIVAQENDIRYVRLTFPFNEKTTWNLNKYNTGSNKSAPDICSVKYLDDSKEEILVTDQDDQKLIDKRLSVYRTGVGLVRRTYLKNEYGFRSNTGDGFLASSHSYAWELLDSH